MKATFSDDVVTQLKGLRAKVMSLNPFVQKSLSAIGEAVIKEFVETATDAQLSGVSTRLTTRKGKEKFLQQMVKKLTASKDEEALKVLEKTLKKLDQNEAKVSQKSS